MDSYVGSATAAQPRKKSVPTSHLLPGLRFQGVNECLDTVLDLRADKFVLVVDDDDDIRESLADVLRDTGRNVVEACDGVDALSKLDDLPRPCLVLLDLMMPRMDGHEFIRHLSERYSATDFPVLVLSAHDALEKTQGYPGVLGTLRKPFDVPRLLSFVEAHC